MCGIALLRNTSVRVAMSLSPRLRTETIRGTLRSFVELDSDPFDQELQLSSVNPEFPEGDVPAMMNSPCLA
jgi:hypothetical protein